MRQCFRKSLYSFGDKLYYSFFQCKIDSKESQLTDNEWKHQRTVDSQSEPRKEFQEHIIFYW